MRAYVICLKDVPESMKVARRCIDSAKSHRVDVEIAHGITPKDDPVSLFKKYGISSKDFAEVWSYPEKAMSAFLSHYFLWKKCIKENEETLILEHDAVFIDRVPQFPYKGLLSLGAPSYGKFNIPSTIGVNPLTSKRYLPGAHAYLIKPAAAREVCTLAATAAKPTDVFLNVDNFPWIEEYYPWPIMADDSFTTIQNENGIRAKHNYKKGIKIL